jgi:hypothetical protein
MQEGARYPGRMKLNRAHHIQVHANGVENIETLLCTSEEADLDVNAEELGIS